MLQLSVVNDKIQAFVSNTFGGTISYHNMRLTIDGNLSVNDLHFQRMPDEEPYPVVHIDTALISQFFSSEPDAILENFYLALATGRVLSASQVEISAENVYYKPVVDVRINRAAFNPMPLIKSATDQQASPGKAVDLSHLRSVRFTDSRIEVPFLPPAYRWNGTLIPDPVQQTVDGRIQISTFSAAETQRLNSQVLWDLKQNSLHSFTAEALQFPLIHSGTPELQTFWDGTISVLENESSREYQLEFDSHFSGLSAAIPGAATFFMDEAGITAQSRLSARFQPETIQATITHAPLDMAFGRQFAWTLPAGNIIAAVDTKQASPAVEAQWFLQNLGVVTVQSASYPVDASSSLQAEMHVSNRPVQELSSHLPSVISSSLHHFEGTFLFSHEQSVSPEGYCTPAWWYLQAVKILLRNCGRN